MTFIRKSETYEIANFLVSNNSYQLKLTTQQIPTNKRHFKKLKLESNKISIPAKFEDCPVNHLSKLVLDLFERLISHNDKVPLTKANKLTRFHSQAAPAISVKDYVYRIVKYSAMEKSVLLVLVFYLDRICANHPTFILSSLTVHRFILAASTAACKTVSDIYSSNTYFAKVGGVSLPEFNLIEFEFLDLMDWKLSCSHDALERYYYNLASSNDSFVLPLGTKLNMDRKVNYYLDIPNIFIKLQ